MATHCPLRGTTVAVRPTIDVSDSPVSSTTEEGEYEKHTRLGTLPNTQTLVRQLIEAAEKKDGRSDKNDSDDDEYSR